MKRTKVIAAVIAISALVIAACVYGYVSGQKPADEPEKPSVTGTATPSWRPPTARKR